jgi:60 kDa SS-A/Ro ribonucleoprotein
MIPTHFRTSAEVQEALLPNLGYTALIRNLGNISKSGLLGKGKWSSTSDIISKITNPDAIKKSRVHPIGILTALLTYSQGHGLRGKGEWDVNQDIVEALDSAFYTAFGNVTPTGKRMVLALDVSGSMAGGMVAGVLGLTPRLASAAMAMVTYKVENQVALISFQDEIIPLDIGRYIRLAEVERAISDLEFGVTDCAQPMLWASENRVEADAFIVYTDSETWCGNIHPSQALNQYRNTFQIPAKLIVVGMVSNEFSIADPNDSGMLDVVGFDTSVPEVMSQFIAG